MPNPIAMDRVSDVDSSAVPSGYDWLFDGIPVALLITDHRGNILRANQACGLMFQAATSTLAGKPLYSFVDQRGRREFRAQLNNVVRGLESQDPWRWTLCAGDGLNCDIISEFLPMPGDLNSKQLCWVIRYASRTWSVAPQLQAAS